MGTTAALRTIHSTSAGAAPGVERTQSGRLPSFAVANRTPTPKGRRYRKMNPPGKPSDGGDVAAGTRWGKIVVGASAFAIPEERRLKSRRATGQLVTVDPIAGIDGGHLPV